MKVEANKSAVAIFILVILLLISVCLNVRFYKFKAQGSKFNDTVRVTYVDTILYSKPVPKDSTVVRYTTDTLAVADTTFTDSVIVRDSVVVRVPIMQKVYQDTTYKAWVSGYRPNLDSIAVYPRREILTITEKPKRWGVGVQAGLGATTKGLAPYIGIGVSYNIISF